MHGLCNFQLMVVHQAGVYHDQEPPLLSQGFDDGAGAGMRNHQRGAGHLLFQAWLQVKRLHFQNGRISLAQPVGSAATLYYKALVAKGLGLLLEGL
eukprot:Skav207517  [mRNA]  locus=scaffold907:209399:210684:- [translate_table: standard]